MVSNHTGNDRWAVFRGVYVEIAQTAQAIHHPLRIGGPPAWINAELGHPHRIETGRRLRLDFRSAQRLGKLGYLRRGEIAWRTVAGETLIVITQVYAPQTNLAQHPVPHPTFPHQQLMDALPPLT